MESIQEIRSPLSPSARDLGSSWREVPGLLMLGALALWMLICRATNEGSSLYPVILVAGVLGAYLGARVIASRSVLIVPCLIGAALLALVIIAATRVLTRAAAGGLFGYPNARGALFLFGVMAALMVVSATRGLARVAGVVVAGVFGVVPFVVGAATSSLLALFGIAAVFPRSPRWRRVGVLVAGAALLLVLLASVALGASYERRPRAGVVDRIIDTSLTERRVQLWSEAIDLVASHPLTGVGPGRFRFTSPTAVSDPDAGWAHNEFLQQAAETGVIGGSLMLGIFIWAFAMLFFATPTRDLSLVGAVMVAALGITALTDYVMHFAAIPLIGAALLGTAVTGASSIDALSNS